jgi:hypothetical protein
MFSRMSKIKETSYADSGNINLYNQYGKWYGGSSKLKVELLYDPALSFIGISLKECKSGYNKDTCTPMFTAALFTKAKIWKQPQCLITDAWIKNFGIYLQWNFIQS